MGLASIESSLGRISLRTASTLELGEVLSEVTRGLVEDLDAALARSLAVRTWGPLHRMHHGSAMSEPDDLSSPRGQHGSVGPHRRGAPSRSHRCPQDRPDRAVTPAGVHQRPSQRASHHGQGLGSQRSPGVVARISLGFRSEVFGVLAMFARRALLEAEFESLRVCATQASIAIKNARLFDEVLQLSRRLEAENFYLKGELRAGLPAGIVGESAAIRRVLADLERVARTSSTVLLLGETGTGKEIFANALHELSPRRGRAFVKVSCAAISPSLIESELFGHEKGAFTGALQRRAGRFELAHGGTLFLDDIGELPIELQAKLLRVLQEKELERVGGTGRSRSTFGSSARRMEASRRRSPRSAFAQSLLSTEGVSDSRAPTSRAARGCSAAGRCLRPRPRKPARSCARGRRRDRAPASVQLPLAGERPRTTQRARARGDPRARSPHPTRRDTRISTPLRSQARLPLTTGSRRGSNGPGGRRSRKRFDTPPGTSPRPLGSFSSAVPPWRTR